MRNWWPVAAFLAASLAVQTVVLSRYHPKGHAIDHLSSGQAVFAGAALVAVTVWALQGAHRQPDVLLACAAWLCAIAFVTVGNLRVVDAIGDNDWTEDQADALGAGVPGFDSGHDLAATASYAAVAASVLLAAVLLFRRHVSRRVAIGAVILSLVFPPWIIPGAGVVVLAVAACMSRRRRLLTPAR